MVFCGPLTEFLKPVPEPFGLPIRASITLDLYANVVLEHR